MVGQILIRRMGLRMVQELREDLDHRSLLCRPEVLEVLGIHLIAKLQ